MTVVPLISVKESRILDEKVSASDVTEATSLSIIYTGADHTAQTPSKKGDIFVQNDGKIYISIGLTSSDWQVVPVTGA